MKSLHHENGQNGLSTPRIIPRDEHPISRQHISDAALKVLYRLDGAGFDAFLVGGCIRDSLLGKMPKDFDVATNATPEQVRELFRNSRLIGRRFRIVHVRFGREIIEVTTFRGKPEGDHADHIARQSDAGLLLRDNVWGSIAEDALRRDFTVNALYYSIADYSLHDFADGVHDIQARKLRLIGDPATRYREDPVRMLRAMRFAAKLDFTLDEATEAPIYELAPLLLQIPPARLFDEVLKLFMAGHGLMTFRLLSHYGLFGMLFPEAEEAMADDAWVEDMVEAALTNTDRRIADGRPVTPAFLLAAFLWAPVASRQAALENDGMPGVPAMQTAAQQVISRQLHHTSIPKRFGMPMRDIWGLQERLAKRQGKRAFQTREHPRFRAAYDLLLLREQAGESPPGLGEWWTAFQSADEHEQRRLLSKVGSDPASQGTRRKRRRRKPRPNAE
ncbi:MAG: polynucleotide adenylyltransferase PcnB [Halomonas subglaciescola]|nr:polynucleotide adenylyltransferase PcnB [Halomonas subglaciescola]